MAWTVVSVWIFTVAGYKRRTARARIRRAVTARCRARLLRGMVFGLAVLAAPVGAEVPDCDTEKDVNGESEDMLCRMKLYRWTCLVLKGYDVSGSNWTVALADYDDCTIRACNQVLDESGGIPEDIRVECDVPKFDRP